MVFRKMMPFLAGFNTFACIIAFGQVDHHNKFSARDTFPGLYLILFGGLYI